MTRESTAGSAMCTLCGMAGQVETDMTTIAGVGTALAWAAHFAAEHPEASRPIAQHVVMMPAGVREEGADRG